MELTKEHEPRKSSELLMKILLQAAQPSHRAERLVSQVMLLELNVRQRSQFVIYTALALKYLMTNQNAEMVL